MPRPATSALSAAPQSLRGEEDGPSIVTRCGGQPKTTTLVPAGSPPTGVAISPRPALSSRLPVVAVAAVLWVTRILEGQARGLRLGNAALCVSGGRLRFRLGTGRADWPLHPLNLLHPLKYHSPAALPSPRSGPYPRGRSGSSVRAAGAALRRTGLGTRDQCSCS